MCKVSVVVPAYNVAPYITECMDSLTDQTLKDIEILCIDAASDDGTREALEVYAAKDPRVKILEDARHSTGYAKNIGIEAAQGEYIGIVESDDYVAPDTYEKLYACAERYHTDIVKGNYKAFTGKGPERIYALKAISLDKTDYSHVIDLQDDNRYFCWDMYTWTGIYKKEFLKEFDIRHNESPGASFQDVGFWLQTIAFARTAYLIPGYFYHYRRDNPYSSVHQSNKLYEMAREYEFGMRQIEKKQGMSAQVLSGIYSGMYRSYAFVYGILADQYRGEFAQQFYRDMHTGFEKKAVDRALFTQEEWRGVRMIADSAGAYQEYCRKTELCKKKNQDVLFRMVDSYQSIIIFGAGSDGTNLQAFLKANHKDKTAAFTDNAKEKQGLSLNGVRIIAPEEIKEKYQKALVIVASMLYSKEIWHQLREMQIEEKNIYICDVGMTIPSYL